MVRRNIWNELGKLLFIKVGPVLLFHLTVEGHVIEALGPVKEIVSAPAVGSPPAVMDPVAITAAVVVELSD